MKTKLLAALAIAATLALSVYAQSSKKAGADVVVYPNEVWFSRVCFLDTANNTTDVCLSRSALNTLHVEDGSNTHGNATLAGSVAVAANALTSAHLFVGNASNVATDVALSGDVAILNTGASTVTAINGGAMGTATPTSGNVLVGSGTAWVTRAVSGDDTMSSTGATTLRSSLLVAPTTAVSITAANLRAINTTPIALVAAPSAGIARVFDGALIEYVCSACTGGATGGAISIVYHGDTTNVMSSTLAASVITGTTALQKQFAPAATSGGIAVLGATGFDLLGATDFTGSGTGTLKVWVRYHDVTL